MRIVSQKWRVEWFAANLPTFGGHLSSSDGLGENYSCEEEARVKFEQSFGRKKRLVCTQVVIVEEVGSDE